jgi:hypothetical protein
MMRVRLDPGWLVLLAGVLAGTAPGCYSFSGSNLPGHIKTIAVPTIENETLEPGIEQEVTTGLTNRFLDDGRLKIGRANSADARLDARLTRYENKVNNYSAAQEPLDYIVVMSLDVQMRDQVKNRELWAQENLTATAIYVPGGGGALTSENQARAQAISDLASDVVNRTLEQW